MLWDLILRGESSPADDDAAKVPLPDEFLDVDPNRWLADPQSVSR
jgi:hypothetical protein